MRRYRIVSASQGLCVSCACRLAGQSTVPSFLPAYAPQPASTRPFHTKEQSRFPFGIPNATPTPSSPPDGGTVAGSTTSSLTSESSLSPAELAEKARRLEIRRQQEAAAEAQERQRRQEAEQRARQQQQRQERQRQHEAEQPAQQQRERQKQLVSHQRQRQQGLDRENPRSPEIREQSSRPRGKFLADPRLGPLSSDKPGKPTIHRGRKLQQASAAQPSQESRSIARSDAENGTPRRSSADTNRASPKEAGPSPTTLDSRFAPANVAMPSFMAASGETGVHSANESRSGWGFGTPSVKQVEYGDKSNSPKPTLHSSVVQVPQENSTPFEQTLRAIAKPNQVNSNPSRAASALKNTHWTELHDERQDSSFKEHENSPSAARGYNSQTPGSDDRNRSGWLHLRRRDAVTPAASTPARESAAQSQSGAQPSAPLKSERVDTSSGVDKRDRPTVEAQKLRKMAYVPLQKPSEGEIAPRPDTEYRRQRICARCGSPGHHARFCRETIDKVKPREVESAKEAAMERFRDLDRTSIPPETTKEPEEMDRNAERASRKTLRVEGRGEDYTIDRSSKKSSRRSTHAGRRERAEEEEDEEAGAREEYRQRKLDRKAQKAAAREQFRTQAKDQRAARKAQGLTAITLPTFVTVQNLCQRLDVPYKRLVVQIEDMGIDEVTRDMVLNSEVSGQLALENHFDPVFEDSVEGENERDLKAKPISTEKELLPARPPVVTIMGHVDHGKTTILDFLRKSSVAAGEAGGITQHIGAFSVALSSSDKVITFLDTPGHAAFLSMRQRGANVTDIVVLVVAADDSVKPQTLEALKHARGAGVPIIVAINKVDKPEADITRCKQDLARHGIEIEDYGGDTQVVCVSGKTGQGMDELEESILTLSEILDHRAPVDGNVEGWVLEATTKPAGRVATILVRRGTLKTGDVLVAGKTWARVKTLSNEAGQLIDEVGPGMPVEVDGWRDQPVAGDEVLQAAHEQQANSVIEFREEKDERLKMWQDIDVINKNRRVNRAKLLRRREIERKLKEAAYIARTTGVSVAEQLRAQEAEFDEDGRELNEVDHEADEQQSGPMSALFIVKADVSGSAEAVAAYIQSISSPLIGPHIISSGVGAVRESDVDLADTVGANIIAFNLPQDPEMSGKAQALGIQILNQNIIYRVMEDVKQVMEAQLPAIISHKVVGEAEVGAVFDITIRGRKTMKIAGCKVRNGAVNMQARARVMRNGEKIYDGTINSLKNVKKDVEEMRKGTECGMGFENWQDFEVGDLVQTYVEHSEKRTLQ